MLFKQWKSAFCIVCIMIVGVVIQGCSKKSGLYVFLATQEGQQVYAGEHSLEIVTYEYLDVDLEVKELLDIYKKYDKQIKSNMSIDDISELVLERDKLAHDTLFEKFRLHMIRNFGLPLKVFNSKMSRIDKKLFKSRKNYLEFYDITEADLKKADKKKRRK